MKHYSISRARSVKVPGTNVAALTCTSKMPGPSFSLPAHRACPNSRGSVCENCYASKGCYGYSDVRHAQDVRFKWTVEALRSPEKREVWISTIVAAIKASGAKYFRGHDSGDFFNREYVRAWLEVASRLPDVSFWFPTREYQSKHDSPFVLANPRLDAIRALASLPNVTVRPSALDIGDKAPVVPGLAAGSTVGNISRCDAFQCPAPTQGGECGACRVCWNEPLAPVSYNLH